MCHASCTHKPLKNTSFNLGVISIYNITFRSSKMENKHLVGSVVSLLTAPGKRLTVKKYLKRIYYCEEIGDYDNKLSAFFERELIPVPVNR